MSIGDEIGCIISKVKSRTWKNGMLQYPSKAESLDAQKWNRICDLLNSAKGIADTLEPSKKVKTGSLGNFL